MTTYWHGGRSGIQRGAYILPPTVTKTPSLSEFGAAGVHRRDRVYVTTSQAAALLYAASVKRGVIYECEPIGVVEPDPDCSMPGLSWQCEKARVIRCIKPNARDIETARAVDHPALHACRVQ
jgi:rifampin ADP-ribosylating transferase